MAVAGVVLVWFPLLAPVVFSITFLIAGSLFRFDYLMPAELFPAALAGLLALAWASLRARARQKIILWSFFLAVVFLLSSQGLAVITGLASGATAPNGWQWALVLAMLAGYNLSLIAAGVGGILLLRDLFRKVQ